MADQTPTETAGGSAGGVQTTDAAASSPELAPVMKVTRAKATTSGVPRRPTRASTGKTEATGTAAGTGEVTEPAQTPSPQAAAALDASTRPANVEIHQGGIGRAQADAITVRMGGVALARADRLSVEIGGLGLALAREANLTQGMARTVIAQDVRVDQGLIGTALAGKITFEKPAGVLLLLAGKTEGPIRALLDWRGALAFGAAFGLLVGLLRRR